jgi:hypothetical protein
MLKFEMSGTRGAGEMLLPCSGRAHVGSMLRIRPRHRPNPAAPPAIRGEGQRQRLEISYFEICRTANHSDFDQFFDQPGVVKKKTWKKFRKTAERGGRKGKREGGREGKGVREEGGFFS